MEEKKKNKEIIPVGLVLLLVVVIVGVSYAAFTFSKAGTVENAITTGAVTMIYTEGDNQITINNAMPITEEAGKTLSDENHLFDFTININIVGNTTISYEVTAEKDPSSTLANSEVRLYLQRSLDGTNYNEEVLDPSPYEPLDEDDEFGAKVGEMVLDVGSTNKTVMYYYRLRMWVDSSYELSEVAKKFTIRVNAYGKDGKYTPRPNNRDIKGIYKYNEDIEADNYCITGEEDTCEVSTCYASNEANSCEAGTIIKYAVNDQEEKYFNVLYDDEKTITLQASEAIVNDFWYPDYNNGLGPLTVLPKLEKATENWNNVNDQIYTMGTTIFKDNPYTACSYDLSCKVNKYIFSEKTVKSRMITVQEAVAVGCTRNYCPKWLSTGWTMNTSADDGIYAWTYSNRGILNSAVNNLGNAHAVIVINK